MTIPDQGGPRGHVFLSYVREDSARVDRLHQILEAAGFRVWRDTSDLWPGQDWRLEIEKAIRDGALAFVACFSSSSEARETSYQNEELNLAVDQMRQRTPGRAWLLPVRFESCALPHFQLGPGRTLDNLQRIDLFDETAWEGPVGRLVASITMILSGTHSPPAPPPAPSTAGKSPARQLRDIILRADQQLAVEDRFKDATTELCQALSDEDRYPWTFPDPSSEEEAVRLLVKQAASYWADGDTLAQLLVVASAYGGKEHASLCARSLQSVSRLSTARRDGLINQMLNDLRSLPVAWLGYAAAFAAVSRTNYEALRAITCDAREKDDAGGTSPLIGQINPLRGFWSGSRLAKAAASVLAMESTGNAVSSEAINDLLARGGFRHTPAQDFLFAKLRPLVDDLVLDDDEYAFRFERTELLLGLIGEDMYKYTDSGRKPAPIFGSFTWRGGWGSITVEEQLLEEIRDAGDAWEPLRSGLFGGSYARAQEAATDYVDHCKRIRMERF